MIRNSTPSKFETLATGHADRSISLPLRLGTRKHAALFSVYNPTLRANPGEKDKFFSELCNLLRSTPGNDQIIVLGDFKAIVGQDTEAWKAVLGRRGV